jgi:hypothetical protein
MRVTHLEHTHGHDKFYRVVFDRSSALVRFGRRGTPGQVLVTPYHVALERVVAKQAKGYATSFELALAGLDGCIDALAGRPDRSVAVKVSAAVDETWAATVASGGTGCVTVIDGYERALAAMPHLAALAAQPGVRVVPSGVRAALVLPHAVALRASIYLDAAGAACLGTAPGWCDAPDELLRAAAGIADDQLPLDDALAAAAAV